VSLTFRLVSPSRMSRASGDRASRSSLVRTKVSPASAQSYAVTVGAGYAVVAVDAINGVDAQVGYAASRSVWGDHRTAITVVSTAGHARPGALVEIDAVVIIPE
jgi:hypothetical protein